MRPRNTSTRCCSCLLASMTPTPCCSRLCSTSKRVSSMWTSTQPRGVMHGAGVTPRLQRPCRRSRTASSRPCSTSALCCVRTSTTSMLLMVSRLCWLRKAISCKLGKSSLRSVSFYITMLLTVLYEQSNFSHDTVPSTTKTTSQHACQSADQIVIRTACFLLA